jgi:hypothetical protein
MTAAPLAFAPMLLAHCSGEAANGTGPAQKNPDASVSGDDNGDSSTSPSQGNDGSASDDGGSSLPTGDGGSQTTPADAAPEAAPAPPPVPVPEGGAPSDPGTVPCNGAACDVSQGYACCVEAVDGGTKETCNAPNTPCSAGALKLECNEAADCNGGVCCQAINGIAVSGSTSCMAGPCPAGSTFQVCRVDGECGGGDGGGALKRCIPQLCTNANPPRTLKIEACAVAATAEDPDGTLGFCAAQ